MKVALIHDWLTGMRGGEKVLEAFCEIFPDADLYTLLYIPGTVSGVIAGRTIKTSFIQRLPMVERHYRSYLPLFPLAIKGFDLNGYDLVVSSSHCVAKGVVTPPDVLHVSYVHTPMRYIWDKYDEYFGPGRASWFTRQAAAVVARSLRKWDAATSSRVDHFIANSKYVAERIKRYYARDSTVIYPPVDCSRFTPGTGTGDGYLIVSAFAPYKRLDLAIEAFNRLDLKLTIVGSGQDEKRLKRMAGPNIDFPGWRSDAEIAQYYRNCRALVFPGEEDFGIVPVEAMASGRPVVAFARGGALETVVPLGGAGKPTGVFFHEQTAGALTEAVRTLEGNLELFDPEAIRAHAMTFDRARFKERVREFISMKYEEFRRTGCAQKEQSVF
jgi:glycosyltransferase involved in cell wall biosynthesis